MLLFICAGACTPEPLDPVVTAGSSSSGSSGGGTGPGFSTSGADASTGAPTTGTSAPGETTGDITTGITEAVDTGETTTGTTGQASSTGDDSSTGPSDASSSGSTGDTGGSLLDPCPVDAPILVDVHGTTPLGAFTATTGVFHWDQAIDHKLVVDFLAEAPDLPWDMDLDAVEHIRLVIGGGDGSDPQLWLGEQTTSIFHTVMQEDWLQVFDIPITITEDTLDPWSLEWDDYDHEPVLGGSFEYKQGGWDLTGTFVVPYCHPLSAFHPI